MRMNQQIKFFSDGGADIRDVQMYLNPEAEHYLDRFHITMRITVKGQYAKGLKTTPEKREEVLKLLESAKHYLWHRNVVRAREKVDETLGFLDDEESAGQCGEVQKSVGRVRYVHRGQSVAYSQLRRALAEWRDDRDRVCGIGSEPDRQQTLREASADAVEQAGCHLVLQTRTQVLDDRLERTSGIGIQASGLSLSKRQRSPGISCSRK